jgi:hypothetical protein
VFDDFWKSLVTGVVIEVDEYSFRVLVSCESY